MTSGLLSRTGLVQLADIGLVMLAATLVYFVVRWGLLRAVRRLVERSSTHWDDALLEARFFARLAHIAPAFVVFQGLELIEGLPDPVVDLGRRAAISVMILVGALALTSFLAAAEAIYDRHPEYRERPIKSYLQVIALFVYFAAGLLILAALMNRSPWIFLSGIGAMTAVLMLVFRDTLLSLTASVQLASNDMLRVGDWIEMPALGADGDVLEIALHTVKVQNFDKTITTIPTYRLISDSFKNWRGMSSSGARRIKRSVWIDLQTIRFLTDEEIERFGRWSHLAEYIEGKRDELARAEQSAEVRPGVDADRRRLTNLGTFRAFVLELLRRHPDIHQSGHSLMVRQLPATSEGVPIEIYCFSRLTEWVAYERLQSDLFDRILATVPAFGLRVFQAPSGADFTLLLRGATEARDGASASPGGRASAAARPGEAGGEESGETGREPAR
ncbi:MAG: mechanosensitive ion channel family protein [Myxococcota bacterium]